MPATREGKMWRSQFYYKDWQEVSHKKNKRGFRTKAEAEQWERDFLQQQQCNLDINFENFVQICYEDMEHRLRENTMRTKKFTIDLKIIPYFKNKKMNEIKASDVRAWQNALMKKGYSQTYLKTVNNQLSAIFGHENISKFYAILYMKYDILILPDTYMIEGEDYMANYLLKSVFKSLFNRDFQPNKFEDRLEMQKAVFLLQNMGISVGDYKFMWYKHGPYSQTLQNDILAVQNIKDIKIEFSSDAKKEIDALRKAIFKDGLDYDVSQWIECLGSLQYIKENLLPSSADNATLLKELKKRKPHLNIDKDNEMALQTLKELAI